MTAIHNVSATKSDLRTGKNKSFKMPPVLLRGMLAIHLPRKDLSSDGCFSRIKQLWQRSRLNCLYSADTGATTAGKEHSKAPRESPNKEDPASEPDQDPNTWLVEAELRVGIRNWETARLDFQSTEIDTEIIESSMTGPSYLTVRTRGQSALKKGDVLHVNIR